LVRQGRQNVMVASAARAATLLERAASECTFAARPRNARFAISGKVGGRMRCAFPAGWHNDTGENGAKMSIAPYCISASSCAVINVDHVSRYYMAYRYSCCVLAPVQRQCFPQWHNASHRSALLTTTVGSVGTLRCVFCRKELTLLMAWYI
jgi:hypothetical protein